MTDRQKCALCGEPTDANGCHIDTPDTPTDRTGEEEDERAFQDFAQRVPASHVPWARVAWNARGDWELKRTKGRSRR